MPPNETRIRALSVEPWPDGRRVGVEVQVTPFQQWPNLHVAIHDERGQEVASVGAIQIRERQIRFTLHLRHPETKGHYTVQAHLVYPDPDQKLGVVDHAEATFDIP